MTYPLVYRWKKYRPDLYGRRAANLPPLTSGA